jgi:hypothetical protein
MTVAPRVAPNRWRQLLAGVVVVAIVIAAWMFIDYRMQPPAAPVTVPHPHR